MDENKNDLSPKKIQKIREESKEMTRRAIIDAAERVFFRDGWIGGTMDDIAREAGLTKGGVLYYYRSKNELLAAALEVHMARRKSFIDSRLNEAEPDAPVGRTALLAWLDFILTDKNYVHILVFLTADPILRSRIFEARRNMLKEWCLGCEDQSEAAMLFFTIEGLMLDFFHGKSAYPEEMHEQLIAKMRERIHALK